jgi:hypothetical protein
MLSHDAPVGVDDHRLHDTHGLVKLPPEGIEVLRRTATLLVSDVVHPAAVQPQDDLHLALSQRVSERYQRVLAREPRKGSRTVAERALDALEAGLCECGHSAAAVDIARACMQCDSCRCRTCMHTAKRVVAVGYRASVSSSASLAKPLAVEQRRATDMLHDGGSDEDTHLLQTGEGAADAVACNASLEAPQRSKCRKAHRRKDSRRMANVFGRRDLGLLFADADAEKGVRDHGMDVSNHTFKPRIQPEKKVLRYRKGEVRDGAAAAVAAAVVVSSS